MERLTIDEVIEHCRKTCEMTELAAASRGQTQDDITSKQYWEHYQVEKWLKELKEYKERGILLPCEFGTDVFVIPTKENSCNQIACMKFLGIQWSESGAVMNLFRNSHFDKKVPKMYQPSISKFGKTVLLTEQEALEKSKSKPWIYNNEKAIEGVFCPTCNTWYDDYYGLPDNCTECGQTLEGIVKGE